MSAAPRTVYVTSCENGLYGLRHLCARGLPACRVVTISRAVGDKHLVSGFTEVHAACAARDIPVTTLDNYRLRPDDLPAGEQYDLLVVNGWNRLIKPDVLARFPLGGLGVHAGHPPIGLGRAPLPWNIVKGHRDVEVFVFRLTERADDGDIVASRVVEITPHDSVRTLYEKVMFAAAQIFESAILDIAAGRAQSRSQDRQFMVHYPKRTPDDGLIDFSQPVERLYDFIRAQTRPYPGAFAHLGGQTCRIWRAVPFDAHAFRNVDRVPGRIVAALPAGLVVQTGTSPLWILEAERNGAPLVPADLESMEQLIGQSFASPQSPAPSAVPVPHCATLRSPIASRSTNSR